MNSITVIASVDSIAVIADGDGVSCIAGYQQGPAGSSGGSDKHVSSAFMIGSLGGVDFTLPFTPGLDSDGLPDVQLYLQGLRLSPNDYSISGTSVTMNYAPIEGPFICSGYKA